MAYDVIKLNVYINALIHKISLVFFLMGIAPVPAPTNLRFSEITTQSFRGTWEHGAPDVALYRITWQPAGRPGQKKEVNIWFQQKTN